MCGANTGHSVPSLVQRAQVIQSYVIVFSLSLLLISPTNYCIRVVTITSHCGLVTCGYQRIAYSIQHYLFNFVATILRTQAIIICASRLTQDVHRFSYISYMSDIINDQFGLTDKAFVR